jgi:membrane protease subunit (stomatin/prohibitin family)
MVLGWFSKEVKSTYLARPDEYANDLIYLHPDKSVPRGTKLTVRSDECVLFFREGRYIGRINAGSVILDTANIPFLGHLIVDQFTGGNQFLCELFYVSLSETIFNVSAKELGQFKDSNSANVVSVNGRFSYTVRVLDPAKLIIELGGQNTTSGAIIQNIFNGRMINQLRKSVGLRSQRMPILSVVSNFDSEAISDEVKRLGHDEFSPLGIGIGRVYDMALGLDDASFQLLREFGKQESELALQEKGMRLAKGEGFAEFNLVQGQRAALEGLGKGLGVGNGPLIMGGMNFGANLTGSTRPQVRSAPARGGAVFNAQAAFLLRTDNGETGPFSPRQIALMAISKGMNLSEMIVRGTEDSEEVTFTADMEPQIANEYKRRMPKSAPAPVSGSSQAFDLAFEASIGDGVLSVEELSMLANLAVTLTIDRDVNLAAVRIRAMAQARGVTVPN